MGRQIKYFSENKLLLEINLIGYKNEGECIAIFVKTESGKPMWAGVIDSYKEKNKNCLNEILEENGYGNEKKIDFLCISHPDSDHIIGMKDVIDLYTNNDTMFLIPNFLQSNVFQTGEIIKLKEIFNEKYNSRNAGNINNLFFDRTKGENALVWQYSGLKKANIIKLQIESITPYNTTTLASQNYDATKYKNDFSVLLKLHINNKESYMFFGDCLDYVLKNIDDEEFSENINYLKIPHHGCRVDCINNLVDEGIIKNINVATCATRKGTTEQETLKFYKENTQYLSMTASIEEEKNAYNYGIVSYSYDMSTGVLIPEKIQISGNGVHC